MQIVWDALAIEKLKNSHTLLELETIEQTDGKMITAYCVVPPEKIGVSGFGLLEAHKELHAAFVKAMREQDLKLCEDVAEHLMGQFGGELDTFYEEIIKRLKNSH
jgi:hypothetical protein